MWLLEKSLGSFWCCGIGRLGFYVIRCGRWGLGGGQCGCRGSGIFLGIGGSLGR